MLSGWSRGNIFCPVSQTVFPLTCCVKIALFPLTFYSCQVNLGIVEADPSSTQGTITIMQHLHQYIPKLEDGSCVEIICNGDGLSIERMVHAKRARAASGTAEGCLANLIESPQEFHKEIILLQVCLNVVL